MIDNCSQVLAVNCVINKSNSTASVSSPNDSSNSTNPIEVPANSVAPIVVEEPILKPYSFTTDRQNRGVVPVRKKWVKKAAQSKPVDFHNCFDQCLSENFCTAACEDNTEGICYLTNILVDPRYVEELDDDFYNMDCTTTLTSNILMNVPSFSSELAAQDRPPKYLTRGMYNFDDFDQGVKLFDRNGPWFYFDFGTQISFTKLVFATHKLQNDNEKFLPYEVQMFVGNQPDPSNTDNFVNNFEKIYTFPAGGLVTGTYIVENLKANAVRFVGFKSFNVLDVQNEKHLAFGYMRFLP